MKKSHYWSEKSRSAKDKKTDAIKISKYIQDAFLNLDADVDDDLINRRLTRLSRQLSQQIDSLNTINMALLFNKLTRNPIKE